MKVIRRTKNKLQQNLLKIWLAKTKSISKAVTRSNLERRGDAMPTLTETGSSGSYLPFGLVLARIVHRVRSWQTRPEAKKSRKFLLEIWSTFQDTFKHYLNKSWQLHSSLVYNIRHWPALATLIDCCSMASWMATLSTSLIELNSSMQQRPPSAIT